MKLSAWKKRENVEQAAGLALVTLLVLACLLVLRPFVSSMLWAAILAFATWPLFKFVKKRLAFGNSTVAASVMVVLALLVLAVPMFFLARSSVDMWSWAANRFQALRESGVPALLHALEEHPLFARYADEVRAALTEFFSDTDRLAAWGADASRVLLRWLVARGVSLGTGAFQVFFSLIFLFFLYLKGEEFAAGSGRLAERVGGPLMKNLPGRMAQTLNSVVRGTLGTALAQALVAGIGFALFEVPNAILFAALTFVLGLLPMGPPLLWAPVGLWLLAGGQEWNGVGMLLYGGVVISGIDNLVRPALIAGKFDFTAVIDRFFLLLRHRLGLGVFIGILVGAGFAFAGLPWGLGIVTAAVIGFTPFKSAGVMSFLGGAIWLFATRRIVGGVWLSLFALALALLGPVLMAAALRRRTPLPADTAETLVPSVRPPSFALMLIGLTGGMMAFGFIGMFIGPVLLALGKDLVEELTLGRENASVSMPVEGEKP